MVKVVRDIEPTGRCIIGKCNGMGMGTQGPEVDIVPTLKGSGVETQVEVRYPTLPYRRGRCVRSLVAGRSTGVEVVDVPFPSLSNSLLHCAFV